MKDKIIKAHLKGIMRDIFHAIDNEFGTKDEEGRIIELPPRILNLKTKLKDRVLSGIQILNKRLKRKDV
jgi:cation transport regulator ChaC